MANRTRPIIMRLAVTEYEKELIERKMQQLGTKNFGAYARKMLIDGYIIKVDYTQQKKLAAAVSRVASNINQICRRINSTGHFYADDIAELKERQGEIPYFMSNQGLAYRGFVGNLSLKAVCFGRTNDLVIQIFVKLKVTDLHTASDADLVKINFIFINNFCILKDLL